MTEADLKKLKLFVKSETSLWGMAVPQAGQADTVGCTYSRSLELKELCRSRRLGVSGTKAVLVQRLVEYDKSVSTTAVTVPQPAVAHSGEVTTTTQTSLHPASGSESAIIASKALHRRGQDDSRQGEISGGLLISSAGGEDAARASLTSDVRQNSRSIHTRQAASASGNETDASPSATKKVKHMLMLPVRDGARSYSGPAVQPYPALPPKPAKPPKASPDTRISAEATIGRSSSKKSRSTFVPLQLSVPRAAAPASNSAAGHAIPSAGASWSLSLEDWSWLLPYLSAAGFQEAIPPSILSRVETTKTALAFLITRIFAAVHVAEELKMDEITGLPRIEGVESHAKTKGISKVTLADGTSHHIIASTGEVIGKEKTRDDGFREDWAAYLDQLTDTEDQQELEGIDLLQKVRSPDEETFLHGISKHFMERLSARSLSDPEESRLLMSVAASFVLAHVSVSSP